LGAASLVAVEGEAVDHEGLAEEAEVLAGVADAVGASEPEGVFEVAVDGFGVVAARVQARDVRIRRSDGPDVLGAVELPWTSALPCKPDGDGLRGSEALAYAWEQWESEWRWRMRGVVGVRPGYARSSLAALSSP
jgi:hypothetical protein